jgi:hypothetical protein
VKSFKQFLEEALHQGLKPGQKIYHKRRKEFGTFLKYDDHRNEINDTCWVEIDDEELHMSCEQIIPAEDAPK